MPLYVCPTCHWTTNNKTKFNNHLARTRPCKANTTLEKIVEDKVREIMTNTLIMEPAPAVETPKYVKPCLKWVGGKTQILHDVLNLFPTTMVNYHEPFVGGASVLLGLLARVKAGHICVTGKVYASDSNANIIHLYRMIQSNPEDIIRETRCLITEYDSLKGASINRKPTTLEEARTSKESYYYWIRSQFNALAGEERKTPKAAAMCLFLNKTNFRGVYRDGPNGFNVPFGHNKNVSIMDDTHIRELSGLMCDVVFSVKPFEEALELVNEGDFVYFDPPYAPETDTSFTSYTAEGFTLDYHTLLFQLCKDLKSKKVQFLMSNADVKFVRDEFPSPMFQTTRLVCRRAIHSKRPDTMTGEVLIRN